MDRAFYCGYIGLAKLLLDYGSNIDHDDNGYILYNMDKIQSKYRHRVKEFLIDYSENTVKPAKRD